jgi:hypothetical protein
MTGHKATGDHLLAGYASDFRHGIKISAVNKTTDREGNIMLSCGHVLQSCWLGGVLPDDGQAITTTHGGQYYDLPSFFRASFVTQTIMTAVSTNS